MPPFGSVHGAEPSCCGSGDRANQPSWSTRCSAGNPAAEGESAPMMVFSRREGDNHWWHHGWRRRSVFVTSSTIFRS